MNERICSKCKEMLSIEHFNKKGMNKNGTQKYQPYCRECNKERSKQYYADNTEAHKKETHIRRKKRIAETQEKIIEYLLSHSCVDCQKNNILVLEFDHLSNKEANISEILRHWSWKRIEAEIAKCEVVCADCHIIRTRTRAKDFRYKAWLKYQAHGTV